MGILLRDKTADFSGVSVGRLSLTTSITSGLLSIHEIRDNVALSRQNGVVGGLPAIVGGATFSGIDGTFNAVGQFNLPFTPPNTGSLTMAIILKIKNGGSVSDIVFGNFKDVGTATAVGAAYLINYNRTARFEATLHNGAGGYVASATATLTFAADASLDGTYEMVVVTIKSEDSLKIYRPKTGAVVTTAIAADRFVRFTSATPPMQLLDAGTTAQGVSSVAYWNRAITPEEVATYYAEIKEQTARYGLSI